MNRDRKATVSHRRGVDVSNRLPNVSNKVLTGVVDLWWCRFYIIIVITKSLPISVTFINVIKAYGICRSGTNNIFAGECKLWTYGGRSRFN